MQKHDARPALIGSKYIKGLNTIATSSCCGRIYDPLYILRAIPCTNRSIHWPDPPASILTDWKSGHEAPPGNSCRLILLAASNLSELFIFGSISRTSAFAHRPAKSFANSPNFSFISFCDVFVNAVRNNGIRGFNNSLCWAWSDTEIHFFGGSTSVVQGHYQGQILTSNRPQPDVFHQNGV